MSNLPLNQKHNGVRIRKRAHSYAQVPKPLSLGPGLRRTERAALEGMGVGAGNVCLGHVEGVGQCFREPESGLEPD